MKNYILKEDTILDGKYTITRVLGEGGFGITYEAENKKISLKVAIKELYIKELHNRNVSDSNEVFLTHEDFEEEFIKAKNKFLQEAKTLSSFSNESGIVHILDYFEENGTAYIVMNYIEGVTLEKHIKENGVYSWSEMLDIMNPIFHSLNILHQKGIIHRDISSNNIMITPDGTACLIDFGTTKDYFLSSNTTTTIYSKRGYTPLEQLSESGKVGPWSDIYAMMSVCYECLTGELPPDVLQRTVLDEYKTLKDNKITAPKKLDDIFIKGLAIDYKKRYQNVDELLLDIDNLHQSKKKGCHDKKRIIKNSCIFVFLLLVITGILCYFNREKFIFYGKETEEFCIYFNDDVTINDLKKSKELLKERIDVLADGELFMFYDHDSYVRCVIPSDCFENNDVHTVLTSFLLLNREIDFYLPKGYISNSIENRYIERLSCEQGIFHIKFAPDVPEEICEMMIQNELYVRLGNTLSFLCENVSKINDYEYSFDIKMDNKYKQLLVKIYEQDILPASCECVTDIKADWENTADAAYVGKFQCNVNQFKFNYVTLKYKTTTTFSEGEWLDLMISLKNRMDILQVPYAIGIGKSQDRSIITIRLNQKDYNEDLYGLLDTPSSSVCLCDQWYRSLDSIISMSEIQFRQTDNGVMATISFDDMQKGDWINQINELTNSGLTKYHVLLNNFDAFEGKLYGNPEDGTLIFENIYIDDGKITENNRVLLDLLNDIKKKEICSFSYFELDTIQYSGFTKKILQNPKYSLSSAVFDSERYQKLVSEFEQLQNGASVYYKPENNGLGFCVEIMLSRDFYYESQEDISLVVDYIKDLLAIANAKEGMLLNQIYTGIPGKENQNEYAVKISISRSLYTTDQAAYNITIVGFDEEEAQWADKLYHSMLEQKEFENVFLEYHNLPEEYYDN